MNLVGQFAGWTGRNEECSLDGGPLQPEILAEVNASYTFIIDDLVGFAEGEHQSFVNYVRVIADAERLANVMVGDQDADSSFLEETDDLLYVEHRDRIDACERLVEEDKARPGRE